MDYYSCDRVAVSVAIFAVMVSRSDLIEATVLCMAARSFDLASIVSLVFFVSAAQLSMSCLLASVSATDLIVAPRSAVMVVSFALAYSGVNCDLRPMQT